jgi:hypothetical protein
MKCEHSRILCTQCRLILFIGSVAYTINPWSMKWTHGLQHRMYVDLNATLTSVLICCCRGHAAISADGRLLFTSNLKDAIDTYSIPPTQHIRSLSHPIHRNVPLTVCSALDGALTLAGSDNGSPRVFDQRIGSLAQSLPHGHGERLSRHACHCLSSSQ